MESRIDKRLKIGLLFFIMLASTIISFVLYKEIMEPGFEEQKVSLYSYTNKSNVNYEVLLKPNILYDKNILEEGGIYITEFVDEIKTTFNYNFSGESELDINCDYEIIARVEGTFLRDKKEETIWKKDFILLPKESMKVKDKTIDISKSVELKLNEYNEFAHQVVEDSMVNANARLNVFMNIDIKGNTDKGIIEEIITPSMIIPLSTSFFEVTGNLSEEKQGNIEETKEVQLPVNKKKILLYGVVLSILIIMLLFMLFFTKSVIKDHKEKKLKKIFKNHGTRLVALYNELAITSSLKQNAVKSIEDLVKISDEIAKPIMYKYSSDYNKINTFYVTDENEIYIYDIDKELEKIKQSKKEYKEANNTDKLLEKVAKLKNKMPNKEKTESKESDSEA